MAPNMTGDVIIPQGVKKVNGISGQPSSIYFPEGVEEIGTLWNFPEYLNNVSYYEHDASLNTPLRFLRGDLKLPNSLKNTTKKPFWCKYLSCEYTR